MVAPRQVELQTYRSHRLAIADDGADGWIVTIHDLDGIGRSGLRTSVPNGLGELLAEARSRIDRRLDGQPWHHRESNID